MIRLLPEALKSSRSALRQVSMVNFHYKPVKSYIGIRARDDVLCASILLKEKERVLFFGLLFLGFFSVNLAWMERSHRELSNAYFLVIFRVTVEL